MSSPIRTAFVGIGVTAVCIAMASLKAHHLLMAFAAASLLGAVWSWMQHAGKPISNKTASVEPARHRHARRTGATVYQFPSSQHWNASDASS